MKYLAVAVEVAVRNRPRRFTLEAKRKVHLGILDSHDLLLLLGQAESCSGSLSPDGNLDLVLQMVAAAGLVLNAAEGEDMVSTLGEWRCLDLVMLRLDAGNTLRLALAVVDELPLQGERSVAHETNVHLDLLFQASVDDARVVFDARHGRWLDVLFEHHVGAR